MPEQLPLTALLNRIFGGPVTALLNALGIHPKYPQAPIPNYLSMEILVVAILFLLFILVRASLSVDRPRSLQHIFEGVHGFIENQSKEIIGPHSEIFTSFLVPLFIFISALQFAWTGTRIHVTDCRSVGAVGLCTSGCLLLQLSGNPATRSGWLRQACSAGP